MNIALLSPSQNSYSETFIKAHKEFLDGKIFYYYGGELPDKLEGGLVINSRKKRVLDILKGHYKLNEFSLPEQALITSFKKNKIDLVFAEYGGTGEKIVSVCKKLNLPLIVHFHGSDASKYDILEANDNYSQVFDYACFVIAVSQKMYNDILAMGCPKEKLVYNVYGPRKEFQHLNPSFSKQQFIAIGRFVNKKAPYYLILSFKDVIKEFPDARLVIAGDGELFNVCDNLIKYYGLEKNIELSGVISPEEYREYLKASLAFVQHSITAIDGDAEGTPLSVLEASAAGVPVLSTYHAGIPDIIQNEENGLLVQEHDVEGMSNNMIWILNNVEHAKKMGANGKRIIQSNFTLKRHIEILNSLIKKAVNGYK
ncbi:MAG: glycosyltransferase family 4 protein [Christiangramia sp.]|uniref:glycosyltransferase family 4 protein n=1 Tax=Christiangramia sp. TaxID=1931228 RepID=UPI0032420731